MTHHRGCGRIFLGRDVDYWNLPPAERARLDAEARRWREARREWCAAHEVSALDLFIAEHPRPRQPHDDEEDQ